MKFVILATTFAMVGFAVPTWAADEAAPTAEVHDMSKMKMNMNPSKEEREKMASAHTEMATCLRSEKEFKQCHEAFHKDHQAMMGGSCPGMEMKHDKHKGMKHKK